MPDYARGAFQGTCSKCYRVLSLSVAGAVRPHPAPHGSGLSSCPGSRQPPLSARPVETVYLPGDEVRDALEVEP